MACASACDAPSPFASRTMAAASSLVFLQGVIVGRCWRLSFKPGSRARLFFFSEDAWTTSELN